MYYHVLAWCGYELDKHLLNTYTLIAKPSDYEHASKVYINKLEHEVGVITNRLSTLLGIDQDRTRGYLALAGYLHDVGKALSMYQSNLGAYCSGKSRKPGLFGHELASMWVAYRVYQVINNGRTRRLEPFLVGVLTHHIGRQPIDGYLVRWLMNLRITRTDMPSIEALLKPLAGLVGLDVEYTMAWIEQDLDRLVKLEINNMVYDLYNSGLARTGELVAYVIGLADAIDHQTHGTGNASPIANAFIAL